MYLNVDKREYSCAVLERLRQASCIAQFRSIISLDSNSQASYRLNILYTDLNIWRYQMHYDSANATWEKNFPLHTAEENAYAVG